MLHILNGLKAKTDISFLPWYTFGGVGGNHFLLDSGPISIVIFALQK